MRPPAIQAERLHSSRVKRRRRLLASMRPPAIQAERLTEAVKRDLAELASMRPPAIQAERRNTASPQERDPRCFNEAACNTGGTPPTRRASARCSVACFNEAACNTGGTLPFRDTPTGPGCRASMRPPAIQAERNRGGERRGDENHASMRPPAIQAERADVPPDRQPRPVASMRPPAIQAERAPTIIRDQPIHRRFNEAACNTGGTRGAVRRVDGDRPALQ